VQALPAVSSVLGLLAASCGVCTITSVAFNSSWGFCPSADIHVAVRTGIGVCLPEFSVCGLSTHLWVYATVIPTRCVHELFVCPGLTCFLVHIIIVFSSHSRVFHSCGIGGIDHISPD
jgi:hypothetical protein